MSSTSTIEIKFSGSRDGKPLRPDTVDVNYLIDALTHVRDLLTQEDRGHSETVVTLHEGSLAMRHEAPIRFVQNFDALMLNFSATYSLTPLSKKIRRGLEGLKKLAARHGDTVIISNQDQPLVSIAPDTVFTEEEGIWVESEIYVRGTINNAGGVNNPNLHLDTDDARFPKLTVRASKAQLSADEKNRLYKPQTLRISILENARTGALDKDSATLLEFVETTAVANDVKGYLDQLIGRATGYFSGVENKERWLAEIRGHED